MKNINELRAITTKSIHDVLSKKLGVKEAKEASNMIGKVLSSVKLEMEYNKYIGNKKKINFLETPIKE
jgi:hypothetical protein